MRIILLAALLLTTACEFPAFTETVEDAIVVVDDQEADQLVGTEVELCVPSEFVVCLGTPDSSETVTADSEGSQPQ